MFPGSFDPFHDGHRRIVDRGLELFDQVVVAVLGNPAKRSGMFTLEERQALAVASLHDVHDRAPVVVGSGLAVDVARTCEASVILRCVARDALLELTMASMNEVLADGVRTVFLAPSADQRSMSSTTIRAALRAGEPVTGLAHDVAELARAILAGRTGT